MKHNLNHAYTKLDWFAILCVFMFPVTFLTVRHGVHVSLFALVLLAAYHCWSGKAPKIELNYPLDALILLAFAGLFLSVFLSQVFRGAMHFAAFDGPSRILLAGAVFLLLKSLNIPYIKILSIAVPVGLICVFLSVQLNPGAYWGERYATYFVDPNTLGSQSFILGILSLLMIRLQGSKALGLFFLQLVGGLTGLYLSIGSQSRGAWLATPFICLLLLIFRFGDINIASKHSKKWMLLQSIGSIFAILGVMVLSFYFSDKLSTRIINGYFEVRNWLTGADLEGSAGIRLSMWKFGIQFANESLLFGYGEEKNMLQSLQNSALNTPINKLAIGTMAFTGPHSDILSKLLSAGLFGLGAYLSLLLVPFSIFWKYRNAQNFNIKRAARIGLFYITGVFIAGLSNEQLSLKYLCTFYGLMTATLLAQVLYKSSSTGTPTQSSAV
jgi:O-antigen ligase